MAEYKFNKLKIGSDTFIPKQIIGDGDSSSVSGALLMSGAGRGDNSPDGDTWIFIDSLGAVNTPWGIKHEQKDNLISFYGAGAKTSYINLQSGNIVGSFTGNLTGNVTGNCSGSSGSCTGNAATASKLETARNITLTGDFTGDVKFDGSGDVSFDVFNKYCTVYKSGVNNKPYCLIAQSGVVTGSYTDKSIILDIEQGYVGGCSGRIKIDLRTDHVDTTNTGSGRATWIYRHGFAADIIKIGVSKTSKNTYVDVFYKCSGVWEGVVIRQVGGGLRGSITPTFSLCTSSESSSTSKNCWDSIENAATALHNRAYSAIQDAEVGGYVSYANSAGSVAWDNISGKPSTFAPSTHNHDDSYAPISHGIHWNNFSNRALSSSSATWGTLTAANGYTPIFWMDSVNGGGVAFSDYNGQTFMQIDGDYYANEGRSKVWHAGNLTKVSQLTNDSKYITSSGSITGSSGSCTGNAATASAITNLNTSDSASATQTKRKIWFCYDDGVTGRPALSDNLTFQVSTNTLFSTNFNGSLSGNASSATLLKPNSGITTNVATWNPLSSYTKCWGQNFTSSSLSSDTGDILYYLRRGDSGYGSSSTTELCVCIDGDYYGKGGGGTPKKVSYEDHNHDDRYYTETEIDTKLSGKANSTHGTHVTTSAQTWSGVKTFSSAPVFSAGFTSNSNATVTGKVSASSGFYEESDERLKSFKDPIKVDLEKLSKLRKSYFTFNSDPDNLQIGVSAQEIQSLYPEIVSENEDGNLTVAYDKLSVIALSAVDQLHKENEEIKKRLEKLESLISNLI